MNDEPQITHEQAKAARVLLGLGAKEVCRTLGITSNTLHRADFRKNREGPAPPAIFVKLRRLYEEAGVEFTDGENPGVRITSRDHGNEE